MNLAQSSGGGGALGILLPLALMFGIFYFLIIRPARNRQRQAVQVQSSLSPGVEVMTTAGLFARVSSVEDDVVVLEVAPGVHSRYAKQAIMRVITPDAGLEHADSRIEQTGPRTDDNDPNT
ncbi:MAG: preprotein translocase subunit YajC [Actinomycetes bacterium]|nr:preprotein translocase subunit YajC [Actinomycetes bacterium]